MRQEIERAVAILVGKPLWGYSRAADMAHFSFGARKKRQNKHGKDYEVGEFALHISCAWRIAHGDQIVVGSWDLRYPTDYLSPDEDVPEDFDWDRDPNRRDRLMATFFNDETLAFLVEGVEVQAAGSMRILLDGGFSLDIFPDITTTYEHWRLFRSGQDEHHFVVTPRGIES
jgi:hypothetical protein